MNEFEVGGLHAYDRGGDGLAVLWHHGTPNVGAPPEPLFALSDRLGLRWVSYDRPGYGGSPRVAGRDLADAAGYARAVADALGIERFAVMGHSGGGSHALACAALLPGRVVGAVSVSGLAPIDGDGLDWFAGMCASGVASLTAAARGRQAKEAFENSGAEYDFADAFIEADRVALAGEWGWLGKVAGPAPEGGLVDDDLAYVAPWRFDPAGVTVPVLLLHGERDRVVPSAHGRWLAQRIPGAQLRLSTSDGHISVLDKAPQALGWLARLSSGR